MTDAVDRMGDDWLEQAGESQEEAVEEQVEAQAEPEPQAEESEPSETEEAPAEAEKPHMVPYAAMKQEREARQELERRLQALEAGQPKQQPQASQPQQPQAIPDAYEDPQGFAAYLQQERAQIEWNADVKISKFKAETKYGEDKVKEAIAWAQQQAATDPLLDQRIGQAASPVEFVVQEHQRSLTFQTLNGKSPEDYAREYAESQGWIVSQPQAETPVSQKPSAPKAPRSLATIPGTGKKAPANADWGEVKFALDR